jgi:hypothetical protein
MTCIDCLSFHRLKANYTRVEDGRVPSFHPVMIAPGRTYEDKLEGSLKKHEIIIIQVLTALVQLIFSTSLLTFHKAE